MPRKPLKSEDPAPANDWLQELIDGKRPRRMELEEFERLLAEYPNHAGTIIYVYRVDPPIDQSLIGLDGSNIHKLQHPYPANLREFLKTFHGGGRYSLKFNDMNLEWNQVATTLIEIPLSEADPILDVRVLKRGKPHVEQLIQKWVQAGKVYLDKNGMALPVNAASPPEVHVHESNPADQSAMDVMSYGFKKAFDIAVQGNDPLRMISAIKELMPPPPQPDASVTVLLKTVMETNTLLLSKLLDQKPAAPPDPMASLDAVLNVAERLRKLGGRGSHAADWTEKLANVLTPLGPAIGTLAQRILDSGPPPQASGAAPGQAAPGAALPPASDAAIERKHAANRQLAGMILNVIRRGQSGADLATAIDVMFGPETYDSLAQLGAEGLKQELATYAPAEWQELNAQASALDAVLKEFLEAFGEEEEPAPEPAHA